ncbi:unnamed protein product [Durusdinium trenchii]|uniref:Uncharacterized protein n=1 Tax=Durusdinium trenchii TaxID=1381693 RepID=A0ABP0I4B8_9DINO
MMQRQGYEPVSPSESESTSTDIRGSAKGKLATLACCCCISLFLVLGTEVVAWTRQASCDWDLAGDEDWNGVIPAKTMTQMQLGIMTSWLWHQVDVYNENATGAPMIGYWSNVDLFFGILEKYAYVRDGQTALEGWQPWGFYLGSRYHVWLCSSLEKEYYIEEDWWARPWFSFNTQKIFNIREMPSGQLVATSQHRVADLLSFNAHWVATVETPDGVPIATLRQDSPWSRWIFISYQKWWVDNHRPDLLPSEVVSFLAAVYDIERAREKKN